MADKKKLDLRKQPPPPPAPAATLDLPQTMLGPGMFQPGQVLDPRYMTDWEKKQLAALGWEEGTPIPGNAADLIAAVQEEATVGGLLPVPADTPPLAMPTPVDISRLPASRQRELRDALEQAGRFQQQFSAQEAATAGLAPGIADAVRVADEVARGNQPGPGVAVVDDRPPRSHQDVYGPPPTVVPPGPKPAGWRRPEPEPPPQPKPELKWRFKPGPEPDSKPEPKPDPLVDLPIGELSNTGAGGITHCPHCSWDLKRPDPSEPDDDDKRTYLMAALAGPGHRFVRESVLLGGKIKVSYRELTGNEADAALTQIADDVRKGRVVGDGEWWQRLMDYRMTQALGYIDVQGVGRVHEGVDLDDIESDDGNPTPYPALVGHLLDSVLYSESIRRAVGQGFMRFQRLCEKLEANADEPSFWEGIGSLR
jgi:hypothetical protein